MDTAFTCGCCGRKDANLLCSRCRQVNYCSKTCQSAAWKDGHKQECKTPTLTDLEGVSKVARADAMAPLPAIYVLNALSATEIAAELQRAACGDSLGRFLPLCTALSMSNSRRTAVIAEGVLTFLDASQSLSPAIASYACSLLQTLKANDMASFNATLLRSLKPIVGLLRSQMGDAVVLESITLLLTGLVSVGAHEHAYSTLAGSGAFPLLVEAARRHMAVTKPDVVSLALHVAMNSCCRDVAIKVAVEQHGFLDIALEAIVLRGPSSLLLTSAAAALICNVMEVPGVRARVIGSGVVPIVVASLPSLFREPLRELSASVWGQNACGALVLPMEMARDADLGPHDTVAAALVAALDSAILRPHLEDMDPVVYRLVKIIGVTAMREAPAAHEFKRHGVAALLDRAARAYLALCPLIDEVRGVLSRVTTTFVLV